LIKKAHAVGNQRALDELTKVGPPPYSTGEGYGVQRKWSNEFEGADGFLRSTLGLPLVAPGCSVQNINDSGAGQVFSAEQLVPQTHSSGHLKLVGADSILARLDCSLGSNRTSPSSGGASGKTRARDRGDLTD
jgi:hypothetical protein